VTGILEAEGLSDFSMVKPELLKKARIKGKKIHKMCALYNKDDLDVDALDPISLSYLASWKIFLKENNYPKWSLIEQPLHSRLGYAGTPDVFSLESKLLVDIKSGICTNACPLQTSAYAQLIKEHYSLNSNARIKRMCVHLVPDKRPKINIHKQSTDWIYFQSAMNLMKYKKG